jgi:hypothetical protein
MQLEEDSEYHGKPCPSILHEPSTETARMLVPVDEEESARRPDVSPLGLTNYFSTQGRFHKMLESPSKALSKHAFDSQPDRKLELIRQRIRDPTNMDGFIQKALIAPKPKPAPKATKLNRLKHAELAMNQLSNKMGNLGIPLLPLHKLDPVNQNRL